jgi:hypothetical protein
MIQSLDMSLPLINVSTYEKSQSLEEGISMSVGYGCKSHPQSQLGKKLIGKR